MMKLIEPFTGPLIALWGEEPFKGFYFFLRKREVERCPGGRGIFQMVYRVSSEENPWCCWDLACPGDACVGSLVMPLLALGHLIQFY